MPIILTISSQSNFEFVRRNSSSGKRILTRTRMTRNPTKIQMNTTYPTLLMRSSRLLRTWMSTSAISSLGSRSRSRTTPRIWDRMLSRSISANNSQPTTITSPKITTTFLKESMGTMSAKFPHSSSHETPRTSDTS